MNPLAIISSACPLILCSAGALFSEYAGILSLFLEGLISFSAFLTYTFTIFTGNALLGQVISSLICVILVFGASLLIEKFKANHFICGIALNLIFSALISLFSFLIFKTRGVLISTLFSFDVKMVRIITIFVTVIFVATGIFFISKTKGGIYLRITGSDSEVLKAKGVNPVFYRILSWCVAAFYASLAGGFLAFRISSFVPNIASGRGWMALAAVFLGKKKPWKIVLAVLIFCCAEIFSSMIQNFISVPPAILLSFPYLIVILMIAAGKKHGEN